MNREQSSGDRLQRHARQQLDSAGYLVLEEPVPRRMQQELRRRILQLHEIEGERAGAEFKQEPGCLRLANLVAKGTVFRDVIVQPWLLEPVAWVLGPDFKLSSLNARTALPGSDDQPLHADMGAVPDEHGYWVCNVVIMLDDYTLDNGALRVVPGSHRWGRLPPELVADLTAPHPEQVLVTAPAGSVVVMNAHLWHGGLANRTAAPRSSLHAFYCRRDKPQQQYQKDLLPDEVQELLPPELRWLLALDDLQNDELSRQVECRSGFLK